MNFNWNSFIIAQYFFFIFYLQVILVTEPGIRIRKLQGVRNDKFKYVDMRIGT